DAFVHAVTLPAARELQQDFVLAKGTRAAGTAAAEARHRDQLDIGAGGLVARFIEHGCVPLGPVADFQDIVWGLTVPYPAQQVCVGAAGERTVEGQAARSFNLVKVRRVNGGD